MPATTRGSTSRDKSESTVDAACKTKMSNKKKEPTLSEMFSEIKKGNKKTKQGLDCMEKKLDRYQKELKDYIESNDAAVKGLRSEVSNMTARLTTTEATVNGMEKRLTTLSDELEETRKKCHDHETTINRLTTSNRERMEEKKRSNLVIDGIPEDRDEPVIATVTRMLVDIGVNIQSIQIVTAFRVGTISKVNKARPRSIIIKLSSPSMKFEVYKSVKNLKGSDTWKRVFTSDDLSREIADQRKELRCLAATA